MLCWMISWVCPLLSVICKATSPVYEVPKASFPQKRSQRNHSCPGVTSLVAAQIDNPSLDTVCLDDEESKCRCPSC
jgi:hypothetical protein